MATFSPVEFAINFGNDTAIFVPFFLVHERLRRLERKMVLEVEGETPEWFMKLMRHEAAHAYSYAYQLYKKKKWQQTFGLASTDDQFDVKSLPRRRMEDEDKGLIYGPSSAEFLKAFNRGGAQWLSADCHRSCHFNSID